MAVFKQRLQSYYRLTKPGIVYGNCLTTIGGFLFAAHGHIVGGRLLITVISIALVMAAGCVYNNVLDRSIDAKMERTKQRALVSGRITPRAALLFASVLAVLGIGTLLILVNVLSAILGVVALVAYVIVYGIGKRRTVWGTLIGAISGALPPVGGYTAVTGKLDVNTLLIFLIMVAWQMPHFYAIAIYRSKDYAAAGLPVWPVRRGNASAKRQIIMYMSLFVLACAALTGFGAAGYSFLVIMLLVGVAWLGRAVRSFKALDENRWARSVFGDSLLAMVALSVMLAFGSTLS